MPPLPLEQMYFPEDQRVVLLLNLDENISEANLRGMMRATLGII